MFALCEWVWWEKRTTNIPNNRRTSAATENAQFRNLPWGIAIVLSKNHCFQIKDKGGCVQKSNFMSFGIMHFLFALFCLEFCRPCQVELLWSQSKGNTYVNAYVLELVIVSLTCFFTSGMDAIKSANLSSSVSNSVWLIVIPDRLFHIWNGNLRLCWQPMSHKLVYKIDFFHTIMAKDPMSLICYPFVDFSRNRLLLSLIDLPHRSHLSHTQVWSACVLP